jgi:hypothetical protein
VAVRHARDVVVADRAPMAAPVAAGDMPAREPVMYDESRNVAPVRADQLAGEPEAGGRTRGGLFRRRTGGGLFRRHHAGV